MAFAQIDPIRIYEVPTGIATVQAKAITLAVGTNQQVIAGVTGKKIRIMGWMAQSDTAGNSTIIFEDGSGGGALQAPVAVPTNASNLFAHLPVIPSGYFETSLSTGLYVDVITAQVNLTVFYILYQP